MQHCVAHAWLTWFVLLWNTEQEREQHAVDRIYYTVVERDDTLTVFRRRVSGGDSRGNRLKGRNLSGFSLY